MSVMTGSPFDKASAAPPEKPSPANLIATLAGHFPAVLVADPWRPHRPLKIGIKVDLVATGVLNEKEIQTALRHYCRRRMYFQAVADGGERYDLDGSPTGEVSLEDREWAANQVAAIDVAKAKAKAIAAADAKANAEIARAAQRQPQAADPRRAAGKAVQSRKAVPVFRVRPRLKKRAYGLAALLVAGSAWPTSAQPHGRDAPHRHSMKHEPV
jgi:sRNA-binding protein